MLVNIDNQRSETADEAIVLWPCVCLRGISWAYASRMTNCRKVRNSEQRQRQLLVRLLRMFIRALPLYTCQKVKMSKVTDTETAEHAKYKTQTNGKSSVTC